MSGAPRYSQVLHIPAGIDKVALHIDDHQHGSPRIELEHIWPCSTLGMVTSFIPSLRFLRPSRMPIPPEPEAIGLRLSSCSSAGPNPLERQRATRLATHLVVG